MAGTKVTVNLPVINAIKELNSLKNQIKVGNEVIEAARDLIASGQSPVAGFGRFEDYSGAKRSIRGKKGHGGYPYNVMKQYPSKKVRPVNLELSGEMLDALTVREGASGPKIGIFDRAMNERAKTHNYGDPDKNIPERHFWPTRDGEKFTVSVQRMIKDSYSSILSGILKKNNV